MKLLIAIYLVFYKGYSVIKFTGGAIESNSGREYGACSAPLEFNYGHSSYWGTGDTPVEAIINCYNKTKGKK